MQISFIEQNFLKKNESIDKIELIDGLLVVTVVKQTARTYKKMAQYKILSDVIQPIVIPHALLKYKFSLKVKRKLKESNEDIQQWLEQGFIVKEIRFHQDGISPMEDHYRIGPSYLAFLQMQQQSLEREKEQWIEQMENIVEELALPAQFKMMMVEEHLPKNWSEKKRKKFSEFCLAFYTLSQQKDLFDFKEIGATWKDTIGGSKYFDSERVDFLDYFEQHQIDVSFYGLVSMGKIVPVLFTGNVKNEYAEYKIGVVHATTDSAVLNSNFTTTNKIIWLVENRAILTRMAVETDFLLQTNSCVICLDGQIRSVHKSFIEQLQQCNIEQTIIWTDTDKAGRVIAKHAAAIVRGQIKIIGRDFEVYQSIEEYEQLNHESHEQEQQLGGVAEWSKWI